MPETSRNHPEADPLEADPTRNPVSAVHGTVLAGALIAVQGAHEDVDISRLVIVVLLTQFVYWLAHVYAEIVGERIHTRTRASWAQVRALMVREWPLVAVSYGPLAVVLVASWAGAGSNDAVLAGLWATMALLAGWALLAGIRCHLGRIEMLLYVAASLGLGGLLIIIKALLH